MEPVYSPIVRVALGTFRALDLRLDVRGVDTIPRRGGAVVAINHVSYLDFMLAGVPFWYAGHRLVRFMAKDSVFRHPVSGPLMRGMKHIPVDRAAGADSYRAAVTALRGGELVGVFPEATISRSFCLKQFKSGAVRMAAEAGVPVIPVVLWGSQRVWTKGRSRDLRAARGTPVSIEAGEPIAITAGAGPETERLAKIMEEMLDRARDDYPETGVGEWWQPRHLGGAAPTLAQATAEDELEAAERLQRRQSR